jgi:hypothetical protein
MMTSWTVAGRERVVIVDRDLDFGLKLADCLASSGYHAVLGRSLDAMLDDLDELKPGAILLSSDPRDQEKGGYREDTLQTVKALYPEVPVMALMKPGRDRFIEVRARERNRMTCPASPQIDRVEELLHGKFGISCARMF